MADQEKDHGVEAIGKLIEVLKPMNPDTRINVLQFVFKELKIAMPVGVAPAYVPSTASVAMQSPSAQPAPPTEHGAAVDLRSLREQKQPKNANQMVAVMAYYLAHHAPERRDYVTPDDIKRFFPQAGFELPTGPPSQTLVNAKNGGYLEQIATGQYRLNPVGHNLVTHRLPADDVKSASGIRRRTARKAKKAKKKKAAR